MAKSKRWQLVRENIKFQIKLAIDALRDVLLSPVAIGCAVIDFIVGNGPDKGYFHRLMKLGHSTDRWLNLFGDSDNLSKQPSVEIAKVNEDVLQNIAQTNGSLADNNLDDLLTKVETLLNEQHASGRISLPAKQKMDSYLAGLVLRSKDVIKAKNFVSKANMNQAEDSDFPK